MDVSAALRELAEPRPRGEKVQVAIERAARRVGIDYWRVYDLWYRRARRIELSERAVIFDAVEKKRRESERNELHELKLRMARLEARLAQTDPDFHREDIAALGSALSPAGVRR